MARAGRARPLVVGRIAVGELQAALVARGCIAARAGHVSTNAVSNDAVRGVAVLLLRLALSVRVGSVYESIDSAAFARTTGDVRRRSVPEDTEGIGASQRSPAAYVAPPRPALGVHVNWPIRRRKRPQGTKAAELPCVRRFCSIALGLRPALPCVTFSPLMTPPRTSGRSCGALLFFGVMVACSEADDAASDGAATTSNVSDATATTSTALDGGGGISSSPAASSSDSSSETTLSSSTTAFSSNGGATVTNGASGGAVTSMGGATTSFGGSAASLSGVTSGSGSGVVDGVGGAGGTTVVMPVDPPASDTSSSLPIANPGGQYDVDGNIPYGDLPRQRLDVMYPTGGGPNASSKSPGVIMFHGGGWIQGDKATMSSFYSRFLAHGFVVCSAEYRVADDTPDGGIAPAAVEDALLAAQWFWDYLDYYNVDRNRYVVTGASAGGHLALMVGMATPEAGLGPTSPSDFQIAATVNGYGPSDVVDLLQRNTDWAVQWLPAETADRNDLALRVSPVSYVRGDIAPLLTVHGSDDTTVPVAQSQALTEQLQQAGADAGLVLVTGAGHGFSSPASAWPDAEGAIFDFLTEHGIIP